MRSLAFKLIVAFLAVSLVGTALVAVLAGHTTTNEFGQFVFTQSQVFFAGELGEFYRENGGWEGVEGTFFGNRPPGMGPGRRMMVGGAVALADDNGTIIVPGAGFHLHDHASSGEISRGIPIEVDGESVGTLITGPIPFLPDPNEGAFLSRVYRALALASIGATAAALILGVFLARALTHPLQELTVATRAVAQGDLSHRVEVRSQDELGELATSFNQMSADLSRSRDLRRQMTADIAHDLRTPLSVILGHAEALRDGVLPPTADTFYIIHDEAERLNRLVEDLRLLSLAEADELPLARRHTSPRLLLERVAAAQSVQLQQRNIKLQLEVPEGLPDIDVDPDRMAQVLNNLLVNASRHTAEGGNITLSAAASAGHIRFGVHDTGPGIDPEDLPRIFDRFYRADKSRPRHEGGSGLGLAIAKSIVERHDGRIWAESEPGNGASFFIEIPHARP